MKIAGRKNDGAWYRTNKWLKNPQLSAQAKVVIAGDAGLLIAYGVVIQVLNDITDTSGTTGIVQGLPEAMTNAQALLSKHIDTGIPRQLYMGHLSWDLYKRVLPGDLLPNWCTVRWDGVGIPEVVLIPDIGVAAHNDGADPIYFPRNKYRMEAVGQIIRRRMSQIRLALRHAEDVFNVNLAGAGNPGGIADAALDPVPGL